MSEGLDSAKTYDDEIDPAGITVEMLDRLVQDIAQKKEEESAAQGVADAIGKERSNLEMLAYRYLKALEKKDYKCEHGKIRIEVKSRVNLPANDVAKQAFFQWLRDKGIFDKYATVNSNSLQTLWKSEYEAALRDGDALGFSLPGIDAPKLHEIAKYTKG